MESPGHFYGATNNVVISTSSAEFGTHTVEEFGDDVQRFDDPSPSIFMSDDGRIIVRDNSTSPPF
jgi:hypothetical protein